MGRDSKKTRPCQIGQLELVRALFDLALECCVRFLQPDRQAVELVAQRLELVTGLDGDALSKITAPDSFRTHSERLDRRNHPARQQNAGQTGERQRGSNEYPRALDRGVDRGVGL